MAVRVNFRRDAVKGGWWFNVPYSAKFVSEYKFSVSAKRRSYDPRSHEWFVEHGVLPVATSLIRMHFRGAEIGYDGDFTKSQPPEFREKTWKSPWEDEPWFREKVHQQAPFTDWLRGELTSDGPYLVLGLKRGASWGDCQRAYRSLAKRYHPDHNGNGEKMTELNVAYDKIKKELGK